MTGTDTYTADISNAYEALWTVLEQQLGDDAQRALAHVCERDAESEQTPLGRRAFLSYLRWAIRTPHGILGPIDRECPCRGSGWYETADREVVRCPSHAPPVNERPSPVTDDRARAAAARGREQDEHRFR